ncbi:related to conserved hypothetical Ustilaginaceae-specific protein [Melanopsichium pennsylvanicum]|uniref:Related to conserved hypothetical Ustilaginaceae-specific protein n=2 Tax=Melanopsichium pennsylvanicum TaxID=63383 RepID=A0AAJ5C7E2_9BASI|nr:conserved hypothetical Ustilago-specific protein [Melanopsichium pennsylvanicum 4]SNX86821.1 related to conserved hypothetical Ustilaginaceae-specific protein [Melanopsichium pennsylvanicum]
MSAFTAQSVGVSSEESIKVMGRIQRLFRGPTDPVGFPADIVSGLSSADATVQRDAIVELRAYVRELFFLKFPNSFFINCLTTVGIVGLLIVLASPVVIHRLYHGRLNLCRFERRMQGLYIVPNAINCFLLLQGTYGLLIVAFNSLCYKLYRDEVESGVKLWQAFRLLTWIPLYWGAFFTGWGSFYTAPGALDKPTASRHKTSAKGHLSWPMIVNLSCLGTPIALVVSLVPPVVLSSIKMIQAFHAYKDWDSKFQSLLDATVAGSLVNPAAVNGFRGQGYDIFTTWTKSYYYSDISNVLWSIWALLFLAFYVPAGGVLVYLVYRQVRRQRSFLLSYLRTLEVEVAQTTRHTQVSVLIGEQSQHQPVQQPETALSTASRGPASNSRLMWSTAHHTSRLGASLDKIYEDRGVTDGSQGTGHSGGTVWYKDDSDHEKVGMGSALRQEPSAPLQANASQNRGQTLREDHMVSSTNNPSSADRQAISPTSVNFSDAQSPSICRKLMRLDASSSSNRDDQHSPRLAKCKRISVSGGPVAKYKYLRRCLVNLLILYLGIISAACCFGADAIYLAAVEYEHALQGPRATAHSINVATSTAAWVSAVFGTLTIGSIFFRNFDSIQPEASQHSGEDGGIRKRFHRNGSKSKHSAGFGGAGQRANGKGDVVHQKTRTLPAVPESVDLEASLMSMVQSRPRIAMNTSMKFDMAEQTSRPGGFVIRPDAHLTSAMSAGNTPEMEEMPRGESSDATVSRASKLRAQTKKRPPALRAWLSRERDATMSIPQDVTDSFGLISLPKKREDSDLSRSRRDAADVGISEEPNGYYISNDTMTMNEYPSFDLRMLGENYCEASPPATADAPRQVANESSWSPVLKRRSRILNDTDSETPASKIAREWAQSQYLSASLPRTPHMGAKAGLEAGSLGCARSAWVDHLEGSSPFSP